MQHTILKHGATRTKKVTTGDGLSHYQPEIYCVQHGWMQLFFVGGKDGFDKNHRFCNQMPEPGAGAGLDEPVKILAKTA